MSESKYPPRTSIFYWMCGGDLFWYHFDFKFLKRLVFIQIGWAVILNISKLFENELILKIVISTYLVSTVLGMILIIKNKVLCDYAMREKSKLSDVTWLFYFIGILCTLMLVLLITGIGTIS